MDPRRNPPHGSVEMLSDPFYKQSPKDILALLRSISGLVQSHRTRKPALQFELDVKR